MSSTEDNNEPTHVRLANDGQVNATNEPQVTEREIHEDRELIIQLLDAVYLTVQDSMVGFQEQWQADPVRALAAASGSGLREGAGNWLSDQKALLEWQTWKDLGGKIGDAASGVWDYTRSYSAEVFAGLQSSCLRHGSSASDDETLDNFSWTACAMGVTGDAASSVMASADEIRQQVQNAAAEIGQSAEMLYKLFSHRDAIAALPDQIAAGDVQAIEHFVDTVLQDIDPEMAASIRDNPNYYAVLEVIQDHDSILSYLAYVSLMLEAIPPNFYVYASGKYGIYMAIEVALLILLALISAGTATAARLATTLTVRFAQAARTTQVGQRIEHAAQALQAFGRMLQDVVDAGERLVMLGGKLAQARSRGLAFQGASRSTITARRQTTRRERKCRLCGSTAHTTPRFPPGMVEYR